MLFLYSYNPVLFDFMFMYGVVVYFVTIEATTICPRSSDPFYIVSYYMKRVTTSRTYSTLVVEEIWTCGNRLRSMSFLFLKLCTLAYLVRTD